MLLAMAFLLLLLLMLLLSLLTELAAKPLATGKTNAVV